MARRFVADTLGDGHPDRDAACLLVSELATNAVLHAKSAFGVAVSTRGDQIYAEVTDAEDAPPTRSTDTEPDDEGGRGLQLVEALAESWGWREQPQGKTVWFRITHLPKV